MSKTPGKFGGRLVRLLLWPLSRLPLGVHRACGRAVGRFMGNVVRYRRDVVMINLSKSFPELKYDELRSICKRFYAHLGKVIGEALWFGGCGKGGKRVRDSHIAEMENAELLNRLFNEGKSIFVLYSHAGNWELIGGFLQYNYKCSRHYGESDICVVYRRLASPVWDRFMARNRTAALDDPEGYEGMIETYSALRYVLKHKSEPKLYCFIGDQFPYSSSSVVDVGTFLSQRTLSMDGAAAIARKLGMPLVYMGMSEKEDGNYSIRFSMIAEDASEHSVPELLRSYYDLLEKDIREQPWNYLWTHKRWK